MAGSSDTEQRIRRLSLAITSLDRAIRKAKDDTASLYQQVMAASSVIINRDCDATINVTVFSHVPIFDTYVEGVSVEVWYPDNTGTQVGTTQLTDSVGECTITGTIPSGGVSATIYYSRLPWWTDFSDTLALTCGTASPSHVMIEATGYHQTDLCGDPVGPTLTLIDADNGTTSVTFGAAGGSLWWSGTLVVGPVTYTYTVDFLDTLGHGSNYTEATAKVALVIVGTAATTGAVVTCGNLDYNGSGFGTGAYWAGGTFNVEVTDP